MNVRKAAAFCLCIALALPVFAAAPKVVKTIPANGDQNVDPALSAMRVVFDQPMSTAGMSIVGSGIKYPKFAGRDQCQWEDDKTLVYKWTLVPDHEYSLSLNSSRFKNFKSETGESAEPYPLSFKTGSGSGGAAAPAGAPPAGAPPGRRAHARPEAAPSEPPPPPPAEGGDAAAPPKNTAPKVISCTPTNGDIKIDCMIPALRVVFDQPMIPDSYSVVGGGPKFPKFLGGPRWENNHTFVYSWRLEGNRSYWLSLNSQTFTNFMGTNGIAAEPYPVEFTTGDPPVDTNSLAMTEINKKAVEILQKAIDEDYSYRDLRKVNWTNLFAYYGPTLEAGDKGLYFAKEAAHLLVNAKDIHIWLEAEKEFVPTFKRTAYWNVSLGLLAKRVPEWQKRSSIVWSGRFSDGIRYLMIRNWPANGDAELAPAFDVLKEATIANCPLIIDVRANGGGSEPLAAKLAGCFVMEPVVYAKNTIRHGGKFSQKYDRVLQPNKNTDFFQGRVAVLIGGGTVSSCESFVMMMKQCKKCTLIGEPTAGCSGNPKPIDLGNGVTVYLPSWQDLRVDGTCIEGEGFAPDVEVKTTAKDFKTKDLVLDAALQLLRE